MKVSRRGFLGGLAAAPFFVGGCFGGGYAAPRRVNASDRINVAIIGCGTQAYGNVNQLLQDPRARITVVCDPVHEAKTGYSYDAKKPGGCVPFKQKVDAWYKDVSCRMVADWRDVIADPTIDAVVICTPDHWHAIISIAAMRAGKHVYCQKPLMLSIEEGIVMTRIAKECGVTFQVGNQGRSNPARRTASEIIRNNVLGKAKSCIVGLPGGSGGKWGHPLDTTPVPIPAYFTKEMWDLWQGPAAHWKDNAFIPGIHEPMAWRWNKRYGNGMIADFSPHEVDTMHWAMGLERTGPVAISNMVAGEFQENRDIFTWAGSFEYDMEYATGFTAHVVSMRPGVPRGLLYQCEEGTLGLYSSKIEIRDKNGKDIAKDVLRDWKAAYRKEDSKITRLYAPKDGHSHESDFLDGIYEGRQVCSECEFGHRTTTTALLANICIVEGRKGLKWDPVAEKFADPTLNRHLSCEYHNGWKLV
ncbi:MAG: Gfo/Idh/MocA family oxidoreductase [bacterium]|nr:Gfo/Idh/MocA family oxidoreductase [bacterium]